MTEQSRPNRAEEVRQERRRVRGSTVLSGLKLGVDEKFLDRANYEYRWINDDGRRIDQLTVGDDYDLVPDPTRKGKPDADGLGSIISKVVGRSDTGAPMRAYLARKPRKLYDEDQRDKAASIKQTMDAIRQGAPQTDASPLGNAGYVPDNGRGITIKDSRQ